MKSEDFFFFFDKEISRILPKPMDLENDIAKVERHSNYHIGRMIFE